MNCVTKLIILENIISGIHWKYLLFLASGDTFYFVNTWSFLFDYVPDECKTHDICDKAFDDYMAALKFLADWLVTKNFFEKMHYS